MLWKICHVAIWGALEWHACGPTAPSQQILPHVHILPHVRERSSCRGAGVRQRRRPLPSPLWRCSRRIARCCVAIAVQKYFWATLSGRSSATCSPAVGGKHFTVLYCTCTVTPTMQMVVYCGAQGRVTRIGIAIHSAPYFFNWEFFP